MARKAPKEATAMSRQAKSQKVRPRTKGFAPFARSRFVGALVIITGLLLVGPSLIKREADLSFSFPTGAQRLRIEVVRDGALYRGIDVRLSQGQTVHREQLSLTPGEYRIEASLKLPEGPRGVEKVVELPEDSPVEIRF